MLRTAAGSTALQTMLERCCDARLINHYAKVPMNDQPKPAKEMARGYIERRQIERRRNARSPLHDPEQIRREIGWDLVERRQVERRSR
jgi:hypothetical protein